MALKYRLSLSVKSRVSARFRQLIIMLLSIVIGILISVSAPAQDYHKNNTRFYKSKFRRQIHQYMNACSIVEKKKNKKSGSASNARAANLKSRTVKTPSAATSEKTSHDKLVVPKGLHLPAPTSKQHAIIREIVAENLRSKNDSDPIELAPLFFNFSEDKLSAADMNPFLIAVEFALQGRTILIEGQMDKEKIRQLMHEMGVPDERISVTANRTDTAQDNNNTTQSRINRRVDFKAL